VRGPKEGQAGVGKPTIDPAVSAFDSLTRPFLLSSLTASPRGQVSLIEQQQ
jgi:hypothetical protein